MELTTEISFQEEDAAEGEACSVCEEPAVGRCIRLHMKPKSRYLNSPFKPTNTVLCEACSKSLKEALKV